MKRGIPLEKNQIWHEESFIVKDMEKQFKINHGLDYPLFYSCKKICDAYGIEQLNHAKAVLQQRKAYEESYRNVMALAVSVIAILIGVFSIGYSENSQSGGNYAGGAFLLFLMAVLCYWVVLTQIKGNQKNEYFLSIICDEIAKRSR